MLHFWNISLVYGVGYLLVRSLSFLLLPLYTNILSVGEAGVVFIFYTVLAFLNTLYNHGMDSALLKFFNLYEEKKVITTSIVYSFCFGCFLCLVVIFIYSFLNNYFNYSVLSSVPFLIYYLCAILLFDMLSSRAFNILRLTEKPYYYLSVSLVAVFVSFVCNYYYIKVLGLGVVGVLWSLLIASFVQFVVLIPILISYIKLSSFSFSTLKKLLFFALPFFPASVFFILIEVSDRWMLGWLGSLSDVGLYGSGYKVGSFVLMVVLAFNLNWQPFYLKKNQSVRSLQYVSNLFLVLLIFITTLLSSFWPILIKINVWGFYVIGESFWVGGKIIPVIALSYMFYGVFVLQMPSIYIKNKQNWIPIIWGLGLLINCVCNYFFIQLFGFVGAAFSTLLTYAFMAVLLLLKNRVWLPLTYDYFKISKVLLSSFLMFAITFYSINTLTVFGCSVLYFFFVFSVFKNLVKTNHE